MLEITGLGICYSVTFMTDEPALLTSMYVQDFVVAFMMGTHSRLGADSPLRLLDHDVASSIARIMIADRW